MSKEVVYVAELDADIDDVVAAEYLNDCGALKCVVLDPVPRTREGKERRLALEHKGVTVLNKIPFDAKYVFCGGALTEVARYIATRSLEVLVMNGGFVGSNIVAPEHQLDKFKDKTHVRTFNFNCDIDATERVLKSTEQQIKKIVLVGKNVCHSERNTGNGLWSDRNSVALLNKYHVRPNKCQHDMLACHEGLALFSLGDVIKPYTTFLEVRPTNTGISGDKTQWGSVKVEKAGEPISSSYRKVTASVALL